jgi:Sigma-70 factor, region 1.1
MDSGIDRNTLDRLVALGRSRGTLTVRDLKEHLPIEDLNADTIALIVAHLEDAGISVELDDPLSTDRGRTRPLQTPGAELQTPAGSRRPPATHASVAGELGPAEVRGDGTRPSDLRQSPRVHRAVAIAGVLVLLLLGLTLLVLD